MDIPTMVQQTVDDTMAYVRTLDAAEALGEILHATEVISRAADQDVETGPMDRYVVAFIGMCATRLVELGKPVAQPGHGTTVHSCTLFTRFLEQVVQAKRET